MVEINLLSFNKNKHYQLLRDMLSSQDYANIDFVTQKSIPKCGYIAMVGKEPIAAGFLRRVEGGYAQFDGLVSNAFLGSIIRHEGISKVVDALIRDAKDLKLEGIVAFTADKAVISRAEGLGFQQGHQSLITLRL